MNGFEITKTGIWKCETSEPHYFDEPLAAMIHNYLPAGNVLDLGCGDGRYSLYFNRHGRMSLGVDGNPHLQLEGVTIIRADLTQPFLAVSDFVVCLEVGEHIPAEFEGVFLDNVTRNARKGIVLSWFPRDGEGIGHVNPRSNEWVKVEMLKRGWARDYWASATLRTASTLHWFKESLAVYFKAANE
jgi:SAM-dependent methyltransferase